MRHYLQLALTEGIGPILIQRLIAACGSAEAACLAGADQLRVVEGIGTVKSSQIQQNLKQAAGEVDAEIDRAAATGARIICLEDPEYPALLKIIPDAPPVLFAKGSLQPRDLNSVAVVGSWRCSQYGREQADRFSSLLAGAGVTIVSGGARGVDSAAHRGAMAITNGRTVAVLGCGVDVVYPPENTSLFAQIAEHGAVLSEFPMGTPPLKENFPRRNRIVSGMSRGVLVIEADVMSGALITARQACDDHGRPVFALPGRVDNAMSAGPHALIRDGAVLTTNLEDILDGLGPLPAEVAEPDLFPAPEPIPEPAAKAEIPNRGLSERQKLILQKIDFDPTTLDEIITRCELPAEIVMQDLTMMTLRGVVKRVDGQTYKRRN